MHDLRCARELGVTATLNRAAADLGLPALADAGYENAGHGIKTPIKQSADGKSLATGNVSATGSYAACAGKANATFAILIGRWKRYVTPPSALAGSAISSPPHST